MCPGVNATLGYTMVKGKNGNGKNNHGKNDHGKTETVN